MVLDLRSTLGGFGVEKLQDQLNVIEGDSRYSYYADIIRAFLSQDAGIVKEFQEDTRFMVAAAATCNPLADLSLLSIKLKNFAIVASLNPSINFKIFSALQEHEHPAISTFTAANSTADPEAKVFSALAYEQVEIIDENIIDGWYEHSLDMYKEAPSQSISEILQLLTLEILGFYSEGGDFPLWQMLEDSALEPTDKLWKVFASLPRVPKEIYYKSPMAINILIARECAAGSSLSKESEEELVQDDCQLGSDFGQSDTWFITGSPRATIALVAKREDLLTRIIQEEVANIESGVGDDPAGIGRMFVLWRIAGNVNLKLVHIKLIHDFVIRNRPNFSDWGENWSLEEMIEGGAFVDLPLLTNPSLPNEYKNVFESVIIDLKKAQL